MARGETSGHAGGDTKGDKQQRGCLLRASICVERSLSRSFYAIGESTASRPYTYILLSLVLCVACATGFGDWKTEDRSEKLWVPQDAQAQDDLQDYRNTFGSEPRSYSIILTAKDDGAGKHGLATKKALLAAIDLFNTVYDISVDYDDTKLAYTDLCEQAGSECSNSSVFKIWDGKKDRIEGDDQDSILTQLTVDDDDLLSVGQFGKLAAPLVIGGVTEKDDKTDSIKAFKFSFRIKNRSPDGTSGGGSDPKGEAWERAAIDLALEYKSDYFEVAVSATRSFSDEGGSAILGDVQLLSTGYVLIILYTAFNLGRCDRIENKAALTMAGIGSVCLSIVASFGLSQIMGQFYGPVHSVLPFILLGVGVDDMFIIVNAFQLTDPEKSTTERCADALSHAGVSITVTSITDLAAFAIGSTTALPALSSFCVYAAVGITLDFLFQIIFFVPFMVIDAYRIEQRRFDCCCCFSQLKGEPCCRCCCKPGTATVNDEGDVENGRAAADAATVTAVVASKSTRADRLSKLSRFLRDRYMPCLLKPCVKPCVILLFCGFTAFGVYGFTQLKNDFDRNWFIPDDSYVLKYNEANDKYFSKDGPPAYIVTKDIDYYNNFAELHRLGEFDVPNNTFILDNSVRFWLLEYEQYLNRSSVPPFFINEYKDELIDDPQNSTLQIPPNKKDFRDWLKDYVKEDNPGNRFESDLVFKGGDGSDSNQVTASRFFCQYKKLNDADEQVAAMDSLRAEVADLPADIRDKSYAFSFTYVFFEQYKIIERELFTNLALAAGAVFIITTLLIAHIVTSTIVTICVCLTIVDILGVMWVWGLTIDGVNVIQLTLAIGLAVDYSAHIGHAFMQQQGTGGPNNTKERHLRVTTAVAEIGASVINGGISTFLAVLMLSISRSYVFRSFFKVFFGIVVLGLLHGLMLLPVLLSYCGPAPLSLDDADENKPTSQKERETKKAASSTMEM